MTDTFMLWKINRYSKSWRNICKLTVLVLVYVTLVITFFIVNFLLCSEVTEEGYKKWLSGGNNF